jgi:hypothetical protein
VHRLYGVLNLGLFNNQPVDRMLVLPERTALIVGVSRGLSSLRLASREPSAVPQATN